jgi:hypothetical protein
VYHVPYVGMKMSIFSHVFHVFHSGSCKVAVVIISINVSKHYLPYKGRRCYQHIGVGGFTVLLLN